MADSSECERGSMVLIQLGGSVEDFEVCWDSGCVLLVFLLSKRISVINNLDNEFRDE